jgi:hypothetical protein
MKQKASVIADESTKSYRHAAHLRMFSSATFTPHNITTTSSPGLMAIPSWIRAATEQDAAGSVRSFSGSSTSSNDLMAESSDTMTSLETWCDTISNCTGWVLRAPSVSAIDVIAGNSTIRRAFQLWNIESGPSVSTPTTRVFGERCFAAEMIPEINPRPPNRVRGGKNRKRQFNPRCPIL